MAYGPRGRRDAVAAALDASARRYVVKNIPMEMVVAGTDSASTSTSRRWRSRGLTAPPHNLHDHESVSRHAGIFHNIFGSGSLIGLYIMQTDANNAVMGLQPVEWQDPVRDSEQKMNLNLTSL